jgi:hypothetical protein
MKTERRHELQTNALADALGTAVDTVKPYSQLVLGAVLAVLVVLGVVKYLSIRSQEDDVDAWNRYLQASSSGSTEGTEELTRLIEQHPESTAAQWSHLFLADQLLNEGIGQLFQNRADAKEKLRKAEEHYRAVQQQAKDPLLQQRATLGLARAYESSLNNLDKARQEYQQLVDDWPDGAYTIAARERLKDLEQKSTKDFYDWFAVNEPKGPDSGLGTPDSRPSFNLDDPTIPLDLNRPLTPPAADANETSQKSGTDESTSEDPVSTASRVPAGTPPASNEPNP